MVVSLGGQKAGWKGTIEEEDGIKVKKNPREPMYGEIKFELEEDLSIGSEDDDNYMFYRVRDIEVDNQGNIYIADMSNYRIQKFDRNGKYIQTVGRQGQGPGEFRLPRKVVVDDKTGRIYVQDGAHSIEIFNKEGNHIKEIHVKKWLSDFIVNEEGNIIGALRTVSEVEKSTTLCKINVSGEIEETYAKFPYNMFYRRKGKGEIVVTTGYEQELLISKIKNQGFVYGCSKEYELNVTDEEGRLLYKIKKDEPYHKFRGKEKRYREQYNNLGDYKPFYYLILTDTKGRIYVQTNMTEKDEDVKEKEVDIFDKNGYYLYKTTMPKHTYVIKDGCLYALEVKDEELVKRYKIKNWD